MKNTHYIEREQDMAFRNNLPQSKEGNPTKKSQTIILILWLIK